MTSAVEIRPVRRQEPGAVSNPSILCEDKAVRSGPLWRGHSTPISQREHNLSKWEKWSEVGRETICRNYEAGVSTVWLDLGTQTFWSLLEKKSPAGCTLLVGFGGNRLSPRPHFLLQLHVPEPEEMGGNQLSTSFCYSTSFLVCQVMQLPEPLRILIVNGSDFTSHPFREKMWELILVLW